MHRTLDMNININKYKYIKNIKVRVLIHLHDVDPEGLIDDVGVVLGEGLTRRVPLPVEPDAALALPGKVAHLIII